MNRQLQKYMSVLLQRSQIDKDSLRTFKEAFGLLFHRRVHEGRNTESFHIKYESKFPLRKVGIEFKFKRSDKVQDDSNKSLSLNVGYVDSSSSWEYTPEQQVVVGLHGATDTHDEMSAVLDHMACENCRVVIPNFPGNCHTHGVTSHDSEEFPQSPEARGSFIQEFVKTLGITRVDLVVAHSSACYALVNLLSKPETDFIKSYALVSPGAHELPSLVKPHYDMMRIVDNLWDKPAGRIFLKLVMRLKPQKLAQSMNVDQMLLAMRQVANFEFPEIPGQLQAIKMKNIPGLMLYSLNDIYFGDEIYLLREYAKMLGITDKDFTVYDNREKLVEEQLTDGYPVAVIFQEGTHYPQFRHPTLMAKHLQVLLDYVKHK